MKIIEWHSSWHLATFRSCDFARERGASFEQERGIGLEDFNLDWRTLIVIELLLNNGNEREMKITILKIGGAILMWVSQVNLFSIEVPGGMETIAIGRY